MRNILMNYKTWLFFLVFISVYIILAVDLNYLPLIPSALPTNKIDKINGVFLALAYSVLAAYIFFYFSVVLPRKVLIHRSKNIVSRQVHWLLYELFVVINQILFSYDVEKKISEIKEKDLLHINGNVKEKFSGYYSTSEHWRTFGKKGKKFSGFGNMEFTFPDSVVANLKKIPIQIQQIRKSNPNFHIDETFSETLSSIETNKLIEWYSEKNNRLFLFANSSEEIYSLISNYNRLKKLKYHLRFRNSYSTIYFYNQEEIDNIEQKRSELLASLAPYRKKFNSLNPCLIYSPSYGDSRAFLTILRVRNFSFFDYTKIENSAQPSNKCIIILPVGIPKKRIKKFIKENNSDKLIILLKPNIFFTTKSEKFKDIDSTSGLYKLFYRTSLSIFGLTLFPDFPRKSNIENLNRIISFLITNYRSEK